MQAHPHLSPMLCKLAPFSFSYPYCTTNFANLALNFLVTVSKLSPSLQTLCDQKVYKISIDTKKLLDHAVHFENLTCFLSQVYY